MVDNILSNTMGTRITMRERTKMITNMTGRIVAATISITMLVPNKGGW